METMWINGREIWFLREEKVKDDVDEYGNVVGTHTVKYQKPQKLYGTVSEASGVLQTQQFGNLDAYDKIIVTSDMDCGIDENSVLFVDKPPEYDKAKNPLYDYIVRRVAKSLNSISIAIAKAHVS